MHLSEFSPHSSPQKFEKILSLITLASRLLSSKVQALIHHATWMVFSPDGSQISLAPFPVALAKNDSDRYCLDPIIISAWIEGKDLHSLCCFSPATVFTAHAIPQVSLDCLIWLDPLRLGISQHLVRLACQFTDIADLRKHPVFRDICKYRASTGYLQHYSVDHSWCKCPMEILLFASYSLSVSQPWGCNLCSYGRIVLFISLLLPLLLSCLLGRIITLRLSHLMGKISCMYQYWLKLSFCPYGPITFEDLCLWAGKRLLSPVLCRYIHVVFMLLLWYWQDKLQPCQCWFFLLFCLLFSPFSLWKACGSFSTSEPAMMHHWTFMSPKQWFWMKEKSISGDWSEVANHECWPVRTGFSHPFPQPILSCVVQMEHYNSAKHVSSQLKRMGKPQKHRGLVYFFLNMEKPPSCPFSELDVTQKRN